MKKLLAGFGLLGLLAVVGHAGTPQETFFQNQFPFSNVSVIGSTVSTLSSGNLSSTVAAPTCANGASGRNCFTNYIVQMPTTTVFLILDGNTTSYSLNGQGLAASGVNTIQISREHLGPQCFTAGNATTFKLINTNGLGTNAQGVNYEGYTTCGGSNNAGQ